jgi:branched-chain amino acid transport system ATP-binding protein
MSALLEVEELSRHFGGLKAVNGLSFSLTAGEITGLIGPNGAGKTTAFNLISGTIRPSRGSVRFKGEEITGLRPNKVVRRGLVRTFQATNVFPDVSVRENVRRGCLVRSRVGFLAGLVNASSARAAEDRSRETTEELIDLLSLRAFGDHPASSLPYGHQRRLGVAIALATQPELLLLDEPVAGLNPEESAEFGRFLRMIAASKKLTILLVEHHMRLVMGLCDKIVVLDHGEKIAEGTPQEIGRNEAVIQAYLGTPEDEDA